MRLTEQNKKYIFIGLAILLLVLFLFNQKPVVPEKQCCGSTTTTNNLKTMYAPESTGKTKAPAIMNFNTDWCGYSRQFQPVWNKFSSNMANKKIQVKNIKCDKKENEGICKKFNVQGYPTVMMVSNNNTFEFNGNRTVEDLEKFANQNM
ncbi:Thioredoxin [seawater metagenome]|uniref:Thioredoxin n=1 Tax=seawater metagenome TaxID=1561972 RepID=A0A5E8CI78_9ZZZZ